MLDLDYSEDSTAETDANFVLTGAGGLVEIQGTAEGAPFSEEQLAQLLRLARKGIGELVELQKQALAVKLPRGSILVVASHNPGKVREIKALLGPAWHRAHRRGRSASARTGRDRPHLRRQCRIESARRRRCRQASRAGR